MKTKTKLSGFLNGVINIVIVILVAILILEAMLFTVSLINPQATAKFISSESLFLLKPKTSLPDFELNSNNQKLKANINDFMAYVKLESSDRIFNLLVFIPYFSLLGIFLIIMLNLRKFFFSFLDGHPFIPENYQRIRLIGFLIIGLELIRYVMDFGVVFYVRGVLTSSTATFSTLPFGFYWEYFRFDLIFIGLIVVILAEIFKIGSRIQQEQDLTI